MRKNPVPKAMEENEGKETSTEEISPEETESSRHNAGAGGEEQGAAVLSGSRAGGE